MGPGYTAMALNIRSEAANAMAAEASALAGQTKTDALIHVLRERRDGSCCFSRLGCRPQQASSNASRPPRPAAQMFFWIQPCCKDRAICVRSGSIRSGMNTWQPAITRLGFGVC